MEKLKGKTRVLYNHVLIDLGISGSENDSFRLGNTSLFVDTSWNPNDYIKRSGKVLSSPTKLTGHKGTKIKYMLRSPQVKKDDIVFIDPEAHSYCKTHGHFFETEDGNTAMAIRYDHVICTVTDDTIKMHNGKLIVKLRNDMSSRNSDIIYIPEHLKRDNYTWVEVLHADNSEGFEAINVLAKKKFVGLTEKYNVGDILLINRFSDFNLQGIIKEYDFDEGQKMVRRENVVARLNPDDSVEATGFFGMVKPENKDRVTDGGIIIPLSKKLRPVFGVVESVGSAFTEVRVGQKIRFKDKDSIKFRERNFIHIEWVILTY